MVLVGLENIESVTSKTKLEKECFSITIVPTSLAL
jgi:hypothetical protein